MNRVYLISPASTTGKRAALLFHSRKLALSDALREGRAPVAEVFSFISALYFRGKFSYARHFSSQQHKAAVYIITSSHGLVPPDFLTSTAILQQFARVPIAFSSDQYRLRLEQSAHALRRTCHENTEVVLLGSVASNKYSAILCDVFKGQMFYPAGFEGMGDMRRGALLLRAVRERKELPYWPLPASVVRKNRAARAKAAQLSAAFDETRR